jgi:hypothetical protein
VALFGIESPASRPDPGTRCPGWDRLSPPDAQAEDLLEGIEVRGLTAFLLEDVVAADHFLTF